MKITDFLSMDDVFLLDNVKNKFEIYEKVLDGNLENNKKDIVNYIMNIFKIITQTERGLKNIWHFFGGVI